MIDTEKKIPDIAIENDTLPVVPRNVFAPYIDVLSRADEVPSKFQKHLSLPLVSQLKSKIAVYQSDADDRIRMRQLFEIQLCAQYADLVPIQKQAAIEIASLVAKNKLGSNPVRHYVFAFSEGSGSSSDVRMQADYIANLAVIRDWLISVEPEAKRDQLFGLLDTLNKTVAELQESYPVGSYRYRYHEAIAYDQVMVTFMFELLSCQMDFESHWILLEYCAKTAALAGVYYKLPLLIRHKRDYEDSTAVRSCTGLSERIISQLSSSQQHQEHLGLFMQAYGLERVLFGYPELEDDIWLQQVRLKLSQIMLLYEEGSDVDQIYLSHFLTIIHSIQSSIARVDSGEKTINELRSSAEWVESVKGKIKHLFVGGFGGEHPEEDDPLGLNKFFDEEVRIKLLGGTEPVVYRAAQGEAKTVMRFSCFPPRPDNIAALDVLNEYFPGFTGHLYHSGHAFGDYHYCECVEYFPGGTLSAYIHKIHEARGSGCFSDNQKRLMFEHFKQLLSVLKVLHRHNCYFPDIKPDNFLFKEEITSGAVDTSLYCSDTKTITKLARGNQTTKIETTAAYASPEAQHLLDPCVDHHSINPFAHDAHVLGMTFFEYLTGSVKREEINEYKARDKFEERMLAVLSDLTKPDPAQRLWCLAELHQSIDTIECGLFPQPKSARERNLLASQSVVTKFSRRESSETVSLPRVSSCMW